MPSYTGILHKMSSHLAEPVQYALRLGDLTLPLNTQLSRPISLLFTGKIYCIHCARSTSKSFQQGYCFPCYRRLLECNLCIIHPERCRVETGGCPTDDWAHAQCHAHHIIYLANASGLKVGITRETQVPTRWIDQGAVQALPILRVGNRYRAGVVEVAFKSYVDDKTNWRQMLQNQVTPLDLIAKRDELLHLAESSLKSISQELLEPLEPLEVDPVRLTYPVIQYPTKINSLSFDKQRHVQGQLLGIKGQYLLLDQGVINLRKFSGYEIQADFPD